MVPCEQNTKTHKFSTFTCGSEREVMFEKVVRKRKGYATLEVHPLVRVKVDFHNNELKQRER